jgi:hypothetical protein
MFTSLLEILFTSFKVENHHRVTYLDDAVKRLDEESKELAGKYNTLSNQEIIVIKRTSSSYRL